MTNPFITLVISCYLPSEKSVENSRRLRRFSSLIEEELEVLYLFNGLTDAHKNIRNRISKNLCNYKNCKIISSKENLGVGLGYQKLCEAAVGKYIFCLTDDDLITPNNLINTIKFLKQNHDIEVAHQLLSDTNYNESQLHCGIHSLKSPNYDTAFAYLCFRYGALPGTIFSRSIFFNKQRNWKNKLYPWIEIAFEAFGKKIAIFDPIERIIIEPGAPAHKRFNDRVKRDYDYGFNERFSYGLKAKWEVKVVYIYLIINWISKIILTIGKIDKNLARKVSRSLRSPYHKRISFLYFLAPFRIGFFINTHSLLGFLIWRKKR